jgi:hypothetical protein
MIAEERETICRSSDAAGVVVIWTAQRKFITQLRRHPKVTEMRSGYVDSSEWAEFSIPADQWSPVRGVKHSRYVSNSEKVALSERLAAARARKTGGAAA